MQLAIDRPVVEWVKGGTPAGIEKHAEQCGIFPPASSHEAATQRTLQEYHDGFENYASMNNEPKDK